MSFPPARESLGRGPLDRESLAPAMLRPQVRLREPSWLTLTECNFQHAVLQASTPVLVDCWATWCMPQRSAHPALHTLAQQFADRIAIGRLDIAMAAQLAHCYSIRAVPTLLLFNHGQVIYRSIGAPPMEAIALCLHSLLSAPVSSQQVVSYR